MPLWFSVSSKVAIRISAIPQRVEADGTRAFCADESGKAGCTKGQSFKSHPGDPLDAIDTSIASGRFFFHVMASLAVMERELTIKRTRAGRKGGRKRQMTESKIKSAKKLLPPAT